MATGTYQDGGLTLSLEVTGAPTVTTGAGAPSSTPTAEGDIYIDTTGDIAYIAAGTASSADWKTSSGIASIVEDTSPDLGGTLTGSGFDITGVGTISMTEQAAANADVAGDGQLWVKTATPNQLWFTADDGSEMQINTAGGSGDLLADGTVPLTANWDVGAFTITGTQFISDIATGTAPFVVSSTTPVANLEAATVTTNANLTGHITSTGNATVLGSFTTAQLNTAISDGTINTPEGTAVLSTGEAGGTKFLREDGDGTCSWQSPAGGGDLLADGTVPLTANWDVGAFTITGTQFISDITTGTAPFVVSSTTAVTNLKADTVVTNADLTGHITSTGNAAVLGSFTVAQLSTALSDASISGNNTGDEATASTTVSGISESATIAETDTGTDAVRHVTPASLAGSALQTKVDGIEALADVTDTTNVTAAGALMDSEVTNLAQVKAFDTTDYATAAQGTTADSAMQDVVDDTTPQLGGDLDCNGKSLTDVQRLVYDAVPDADHTATGPTTDSINAGATIAAFELCYLGTGGKWLLTDANAAATAGPVMLGLALEAGTDTNPMDVALPGSFVRDDTWAWTVGAELYVSGTAGAMTETAPAVSGDIVRFVGYAISADVIFFNPDNSYVTI